MRKFVLAFALAAAAAPAFAQATAVVDPTATTPAAVLSMQQVVTQCELVAADSGGDASPSGQCLSSTQTFLDGLAGAEPAVVDQNITDLVVAIAPLVQDDICNAADEEIAQAIRLASTKASDPEQVSRLVAIAETVEACAASETAAIEPEPEVPAATPASAA